ncbi:putative serine esterase-domain-containing protein [Mycena amicta]|nr:putative serine esterase-domain-containing protein [Mycena amicta]
MASSSECHLLVITHGMWGHPNHVGELDRMIKETHPGPQLHVLRPQTNREENTYDGIDWGGERVAEEIVQTVAELKDEGRIVTRFSMTGYSLGGLVSRYVVGILHQRGFFKDITPVNFNTIATPHLGVPRMPSSFFSSLASVIGPRLLSRTGEQFYCVDKWLKGRPLLDVMADPDQVFYQALAAFQTIRIYANAVNDNTVPYVTAAIEVTDPFIARNTNGLEVEIDEKYSPRVLSYHVPEVPPPPSSKPTLFTPKWFKSVKFNRPPLPPFLNFRFPFNYVIYLFIPVLIPTFITLALLRLSLATRSSRLRIRLLEADAASPGSVERLAHVLAKLESQMESTVLDLVDETSVDADSSQVKTQPRLTPVQRRIAANLNRLPLTKEIAYFPTIRFAHAVIVCRDVKNFESHKAGANIVKHWAGVFIL